MMCKIVGHKWGHLHESMMFEWEDDMLMVWYKKSCVCKRCNADRSFTKSFPVNTDRIYRW